MIYIFIFAHDTSQYTATVNSSSRLVEGTVYATLRNVANLRIWCGWRVVETLDSNSARLWVMRGRRIGNSAKDTSTLLHRKVRGRGLELVRYVDKLMGHGTVAMCTVSEGWQVYRQIKEHLIIKNIFFWLLIKNNMYHRTIKLYYPCGI